jgi:hypothetical protein
MCCIDWLQEGFLIKADCMHSQSSLISDGLQFRYLWCGHIIIILVDNMHETEVRHPKINPVWN